MIDQTTILLNASIVIIVTGIAISKALIASKHLKEKERELLHIKYTLIDTHRYQLDWEVIEFTIRYINDNPDASFTDAIEYGYQEWVK
jgi:hypothetical protein